MTPEVKYESRITRERRKRKRKRGQRMAYYNCEREKGKDKVKE